MTIRRSLSGTNYQPNVWSSGAYLSGITWRGREIIVTFGLHRKILLRKLEKDEKVNVGNHMNENIQSEQRGRDTVQQKRFQVKSDI